MNQDNLNNVVDNNVDNKVVNNLDSNINDSKETVNIPDVVVEEEEKIYDLSDASVHEEVGVSVDNISSVSISRNWGAFVFWLGLGLALMGIGIGFFVSWDDIDVVEGWIFTVLAIVSFIIAFIMRNKKDIVVKAFHTSATFRYTINDPEKSKQLLNSMLKCLIDNR
jgi:hypothetical protein